jgi:hypothetical protein
MLTVDKGCWSGITVYIYSGWAILFEKQTADAFFGVGIRYVISISFIDDTPSFFI